MALMSWSCSLHELLDVLLSVGPTEHTITLQTATELRYGFYSPAPCLVRPRVDCSLAAGQ